MQDAEHSEIGSDGDSQGADHGQGKARSFVKLANRVAQIVPEIERFVRQSIHLVRQV